VERGRVSLGRAEFTGRATWVGLERERWEVGVREFGAGGDDGAYTWVDWSESGDGGVGVGAPGAMARNVHTHEEAISLKCTS
jgi:hypothetical protein